jgi:hypothetical protein
MADIDFLPIEYHLQHARQQVKPWRVIVVVSATLLLGAAICTQYCQRRQARRDLQAATAVHETAARQNAIFAKFQTQLQAARSEAELFTYLRHPWPRSQLLSAVVTPMTGEITVHQIQIAAETPAEQPVVDARPRAEIKAEEEKLRKSPPAQRDFKLLHGEFDKQRSFVRIAGVTTDAASLYRYLNAVAKESFFAKVELRSIESVDTPQGPVMHFHAFLQVRPGYGQPGGPKGRIDARKQTLDRNPKLEIRNPKQFQMTEIGNERNVTGAYLIVEPTAVRRIGISDFGFVSDLGFGIWDFFSGHDHAS